MSRVTSRPVSAILDLVLSADTIGIAGRSHCFKNSAWPSSREACKDGKGTGR